MLDQARITIRSVAIECRQWSDSYGQTHSSAALWINNRYAAAFSLRYGDESVLEDKEIAPYLESLGIVSPLDQHRALTNRCRANGVDYYQFTTQHKKRDCFNDAHALTPLELLEEINREETVREMLRNN